MIKKGIFNRIDPLQSEYHISELYSYGDVGNDAGKSIFIDDIGNLYIGGKFSLTINIDLLGGIHEIISNGSTDSYLVKYDSDRNIIWCKQWGGSGADDGRYITIKNDIIYIVGVFQDTVDFNTSSEEIFNLTSIGSDDIYILKLNLDGGFINAVSIGSTGKDRSKIITVDDNGDFYLPVKFYNGLVLDTINGIEVINVSGVEAMLVKFNSDLKVVWYRVVVSNTKSEGEVVALDNNGFVYYSGIHSGQADLDTGEGVNLVTSNNNETHILKFDSLGNQIWTRVIETTYRSQVRDIAIKGDYLYIAGSISGQIDFGTGVVIDTEALYGTIGTSAFVAKYDLDSNLQWFRHLGGAINSDCYNIAITQDDSVVMTCGSSSITRYIDDGLGGIITQTNPLGGGSHVDLVYSSDGILKYHHENIGLNTGVYAQCVIDSNNDILIIGAIKRSISYIIKGVRKDLYVAIEGSPDVIFIKYKKNNK